MRILHMLNWQLENITPFLDQIKEQGFDAIQINPMQPCKENVKNAWWMSYQPINFEIGNEYGGKKQLIDLCNNARIRDIDIIVDVVCNHLGNQSDVDCLTPNSKCDLELLNNPECWKKQLLVENYDDRYEVTNYSIGLPGLNPNNELVQKKILKYLCNLKDCGVTGFRFDAAKHIALPEEGCSLWRIIKCFLDVTGTYAYGEILGDNYELADLYSQYFDVLTHKDNHVPYGNLVTYIESHDDYLHNNTSSIKNKEIAVAYKDLCKKNDKTIYYMRPNDHFALYSEDIKKGNSYNHEKGKELRKAL